MHSNSNPRSALLSGLRTGGVRSASQSSIVPHTAAIGGGFNMQRHPSYTQQHSHFPEEEEELADMLNYGMQLNGGTHNGNHRIPASAGPLDGSNRFQQQQQAAFLQQMAAQRQLNGVNGMGVPGLGAVDQMQMQLMQLELMKLQALQQAQQQYQVELELLAQSQRQQQLQQQQQQQQQQRGPSRRPSTLAFGGEPPATAGPGQTSFEVRGSPQFIRTQSESPNDQDVPKTAALSGKFGGRPVLSGLNPNATVFTMSSAEEPSTPKTATPGIGRTTVISGGTSLGSISTPAPTNAPATPSKSDSASSWRRPNAVANGGGSTTPTRSVGVPTSASSPTIRLAPGGEVDIAPLPLRSRPSPLRFGDRGISVDVETGSESELDYYTANIAQLATSASSSSDNEKDSSPSTPPSAGSSNPITREEASKRLYEGLGIGRPIQLHVPPVHIPKQPANTVLRQPRGPPAAVDELGPRNFASRMQKKLVMAA